MRRSMVLTTLLLLLAACTANTASEEPMIGAVEPAPGDGGSEADFVDATVALDSRPTDRRVIMNADLRLQSDDTRATYDRILAVVEDVGGFVASAVVHPTSSEDRQPEISMVLRVPVEELTSTMRAIKGLASEVVSESQSAEDVSEQFVDLEARLVNLEALEVELRALLTEVRAQPDADPAKLLQVFNELANVRGQIEQTRGQLEYLSNLTEMATLQIGLSQTPAAVPVVDEPWAPMETVRDAARDLVTALQTVANGVIAFVVHILPLTLLALVGPAIVAVVVYRKLRGVDGPSPVES